MNALSNSSKNPAIGLVILMLSSLLLAGVVAEVNDGNGSTGIDRNPNPAEYDGMNVLQQYDNPTTHSNTEISFQSGMKGAVGNDGSIQYKFANGNWDTGDGSSAEFDGDRSNVSIASGESTVITMRNVADTVAGGAQATNLHEVSMTLKNWYSTIDRSSPHTFTDPAQNSKVDGCDNTVDQNTEIQNVVVCTMNGDGGISQDLPTTLLGKPATSTPVFSWGIHSSNDTRNLYFGIDYEVAYNMDVYVNGVKQTVGGSVALLTTDLVELRCSAVDCTQDNVIIGVPGAYNGSGANFVGANGLTHDASDEVLNSTARIGIFSTKIVKMTFGLADSNNDGTVDDDANVSAGDGGIFYDPAVSFDVDEPGVRVGQIEDGGASWCDAKWFLAKCSSMTLDGNASDGVDGMFMKVNVPVEGMFSLASWGGFDEAKLNLMHEDDNCWNGDIRSYVLTETQFDSAFTTNNLLTYGVSGDYYSVSTPVSGFNTATSYGSASADYCQGKQAGSVGQTNIEIDRIAQMSANSLFYEYNQGFYDMEDEVYSFYILVTVEESTTCGDLGNGCAIGFDAEQVGLTLKHTNAYDPLTTASGAVIGDIVRSTNTTGQTNPAHASPYVNYYSGITPSDNVIAGRNLSGSAGGVADDFGPMWMGTQTVSNQVRKASEYYVSNFSTETLSTIECGLATTGAITSAKIEIFTNLDTSQRMGAGQNGSGVSVETEWKEYGVLSDNSSVYTMGPASTYASTPSNWGYTYPAVDNDEVNANSNSVSFTGVFINGDTYKVKCTTVYDSFDVGAQNVTTTTLVYEQTFTASYDGNYVGSGGSDVAEEDESWIEEISGWDLLIIALALAIAGLGIYMWAVGPKWSGWFDDRSAMILFGVGLLHAWFAHNFGPDMGTGDISEDTAMIVGTLGYLVMTASVYLYGAGTTSMSERNFRYALGGLFLIIIGIPTTLGGLLGIESELLEEAMWTFPIYELISAVGSFVGILLLSASAVSIFRREGM